jgi:hypothetical protein
MDREKLKVIVQNLESLVESLKTEIHSDTDTYKDQYEQIYPNITNYDEVFYEDADD